MSGKNRRLVADELVKFETSGNLPISLEEYIESTQMNERKIGRCQHLTGWITRILTSDRGDFWA